MNATTAFLTLALFNAVPQTADIDAKAVFEAKCASCHSVESEGIAAGNLHVVQTRTAIEPRRRSRRY